MNAGDPGNNDPVIVVGGGWAGLSAAVELARQNIPVTLLESAKQLGGRARSVTMDHYSLDNGQHILLGAYHKTLELMHTIGIDLEKSILRRPLLLNYKSPNGMNFSLKGAKLPAPLNIAWAILNSKGLALSERLSALKMCVLLIFQGFTLQQDITVEELLNNYKQSPRLISALWEPLCLATLNTPVKIASAEVFLQVLKDSFTNHASDSDLLLYRLALDELIPLPAQRFIEQHSGTIKLTTRVTDLIVNNNKVRGVLTNHGEINTNNIILATPHAITEQLLSPHAETQELSDKLSRITSEPICTVYLDYGPGIQMDIELLGMLNTVGQWIFDRRLNGQPGLMAVVISSSGEHMEWDNDKLTQHIADEVASLFPQWPTPTNHWVLREKRATFSCTKGINALRPDNATPIKGLYLCGDYTNTLYPATLEGAIRSGVQCAQVIRTNNYL